jgi:pyruvate-formate lyase-activating enzyme
MSDDENDDQYSDRGKGNRIQVKGIKERGDEINKISPSFCSAKWLQSTIYLHTGNTHSCHHPVAHKIPEEELEGNPSALHNTKFKKEQRTKMLNGERPAECEYCWNIEDLEEERISDRIYKSTDEEWSMPFIDKVINTKENEDINPSYLEIAFDNVCNLQCAYCTPDISTQWYNDINKNGPYPTSWNTGNLGWLKKIGRMPIHPNDHNPYTEKFWEWWPELYPDLTTFRITGGEPLLSAHTWKILKYVTESPRKELNLILNTNLCINNNLMEDLIKYAQSITPQVNTFDIYTSCEAHGEQAEYIRHGLDYKAFKKNIFNYLNRTPEKCRVHYMVTFNLMSVTSFTDFLDDIKIFRNLYNPDLAFNRSPLMISYLRWPPYLAMNILTKDIKEKFGSEIREYAQKNQITTNKQGFLYLEEIDQLERLCEFMLQEPPEDELLRDRKDFAAFITEFDKRKETSFKDVFPDLAEFYELCLSLE